MKTEVTQAPKNLMEQMRANDGRTLLEITAKAPTLIVFLRHSGCTFCRETLGDLVRHRARIEEKGTQIVLVHLGPESSAGKFIARYGLGDLPRISDPERRLYQAFQLPRATLGQLFAPTVWVRGVAAVLQEGHFVGIPDGDPFQMPGSFLVHGDRILKAFRHQSAADRPDYEDMASCDLMSA